ncbi:MAG: putative rRNA maturation factor [Aliidongia sp.]|nr:putative rRNA maturation factor [Aliidongia sp.]
MTSDRDHGTETIAIDLLIEADGWSSALGDAEAVVVRAARAACVGLDAATISVLLTDDHAMQALNNEWRGQDKPTNVLSFPATQTRAGEIPRPEFPGVPLELGDIALGFEICRREAVAQGKPLAHHVEHLVVHGVLHLLGYDHQDEVEAEQMESLETRILSTLGIPDPYAVPPDGDD